MGVYNYTEKERKVEIIENSHSDKLYMNDFGNGKFFNVTVINKDQFNIELTSKTQITLTFIKDKSDIQGMKITKVIDGQIKGELNISCLDLNQLKLFAEFIGTLNLNEVTERKTMLPYKSNHILAEDVELILSEIFKREDGVELIESFLKNENITSKDIVNTGYRKHSLKVFGKLLNEPEYWKDYATGEQINGSSEEKVWQYFLQNNNWILGYGLDYRYQSILQKEANISDVNMNGKGVSIIDYLLGDKKFTTFVEVKKPSTKLFRKSQNRTNSWKLSNDLIDSYSQILEYKSSGLVKFDKEQIDGDGNYIKQKTYDSKVILIIGQWNEIEDVNDFEKKVKMKTFELFRRDSRNIDIITYDELYERALFIVKGNS